MRALPNAASGKHGQGGFTLVEMLASLAIITIVLPVAMEAISLATRTAGVARQRLEAANLAETQLAQLATSGAWQTGNLSGDFSPDWPAYSWTAQVTPYQGTTAAAATTLGAATTTSPTNAALGSSLQELDVTVTWTDAGGTAYSVTLSTLIYSGSP